MTPYDTIIIGGGIVGLATAYRLLQARPDTSLALLEKETQLAQHQTGRNSGVLHAGIYYKPGSQKAVTCRAGKQALQSFCEREGVPFALCGKVVVAVDEREIAALDAIFERAQANGVVCRRIGRSELRAIEPHTAGIAAIHVPETGIVDYPAVCRHLAARIVEAGGSILTDARVTNLTETGQEVVVESHAGMFFGRTVVNCAGLYADTLARMAGLPVQSQIVPFRGEYFVLAQEAEHLCRGLIYPVPDPRFPFLGVHFTRMIHGGVECGPNAVLALAREGYRKWDVNGRELANTLSFAGFRKLAKRYWRYGAGEMWRSFNKRAFVTALQRLVPEIGAHHLQPAPAGIRAQAIAPDGSLVDDFAFAESARMVHVLNAPSPAATACLEIGRIIAAKLIDRLEAR